MATKLSKMQAQAIISKLGREYNSLRDKLIAEDTRNYTPSANAAKLSELIQKRDRLKAASEAATEEAKRFAEFVGIQSVYAYTKEEEAISKLKTLEIKAKYPKIDLDAALDDLIIGSVEDDFSVDNFIGQYLEEIKNG